MFIEMTMFVPNNYSQNTPKVQYYMTSFCYSL